MLNDEMDAVRTQAICSIRDSAQHLGVGIPLNTLSRIEHVYHVMDDPNIKMRQVAYQMAGLLFFM